METPESRHLLDDLELCELMGGPAAWAEAVGTQPIAGLSVASWTWLRRAEPATAGNTAFIRLPHDFLTERLTGNGVTDRGMHPVPAGGRADANPTCPRSWNFP